MSETPSTLVRRLTTLLERAFAGDDRGRNAALDARLLVAHALGLDATSLLLLHGQRALSEAEVASAYALAERRASGEPVARILGRKGFWTLDLALSPETLVPRPDTETLVEAALAWVRARGISGSPLSILDLGTGSGAILLALLSELPAARGVGLDRAMGAVRTARRNADDHGIGGRAAFVVGDWLEAIAGHFDLVVSNPPYIPRAEIETLAVDVKVFDPDMALDGGRDGLVAYRRIFASLDDVLAPEGAAFFEVGAGQAAMVATLAAPAGFGARIHRDLGGIDRVVELGRAKESRQKMDLETVSEQVTFRSP